MKTAAVIVAAGRGLRAGGGIPKQWRDLAGRTATAWSLAAFRTHPGIDRVVLVLGPDYFDLRAGYEAFGDVMVTLGDTTRSGSVKNGLEVLADDAPDLVLIHDVARPCISKAVIDGVLTALKTHRAAAPAVAVSDALWHAQNGEVHTTPDRTGLFRAQTPQGFHFADILAAHRALTGEAADDVAVARAAGIRVAITQGAEDNLKITTPGDFARAERILRGKMDIRTGNGFDVHAFEAGDHVVLNGVKIPHTAGLKGHSDADVAMHALTDAIYGALAEGDIGQWFPPTDARWKGAASSVFLAHAVQLAADQGFTITHTDITIICETPKIGPYVSQMKPALSALLGIETGRISVKATTSEQLGFTGRGEGIAAMATATLVKT